MVNTAIVLSYAEGIIKNTTVICWLQMASTLFSLKPGGTASYIVWDLSNTELASTKTKVLIENFEQVKAQFLLDIKAVVEMEDILFDLIITWEQTGIHYVPVGSWIMDKEG